MLGPAKARDLNRPVVVSLEQLVPAEHFYRQLEAELDLSFVRQWVKECYTSIGRPSIDPIVFFKLQLVMFFEGLRFERQLVEIAGLNLAHRWYLGDNLDESMPDHSSLTRIRQRLDVDIFRRFFEHVVDLCNQAGLIWGKELLVDATKVRANAAMDSLVPRLAEVVDDHLVELFGDQGDPAEPVTEEDDAPPLLHPEGRAGMQVEHPAGERRWDVVEECRLDPERSFSPGDLRSLSGTRPLYLASAGQAHLSVVPCQLPGTGARLSRHAGVPEGHAEAERVGRAALR